MSEKRRWRPNERHLAFNTQSLLRRSAIVAAGPAANLLLAVLLYSVVNWTGVQLPSAILAPPQAESLAAQAGLVGGERVLRAALDGEAETEVLSFEDLRWQLTRGALEGQDVRLLVQGNNGATEREFLLRLSGLDSSEVDARMFQKIGVLGPMTRPVIGDVMPDSAAAQAGLLAGDEVTQVDGKLIVDGQQLRALIRQSVTNQLAPSQVWSIVRDGKRLQMMVTPRVVQEQGQPIGRIGAYVGAPPEQVLVRYGAFDGSWLAHRQNLGCLGFDAQDDGQDADREGLHQEHQRPADDCRLRRQVSRSGVDPVPDLSGTHQRQSGRFEFAALAGSGWRTPDVLSLGECHRPACFGCLDGAAAARRCRHFGAHDVDCSFQRRFPLVRLVGRQLLLFFEFQVCNSIVFASKPSPQ